MPDIRIVPATEQDVPAILDLIRGLAEYERLSHVVEATEERLRRTLFSDRPAAEVRIAWEDQECVGFALFFTSYSTFLGKPGLYLEDVFVKPHARRKGIGLKILQHLAAIAQERDYGRMEWSVLDWNQPAINFYKKLGADPLDDWTMFRLTGDALRNLGKHHG
jgi:GNAT superfamily N-acetyltransferase